MSRLNSAALLAVLALAVQPLTAQLDLSPSHAYTLPEQHSYIIGLDIAHVPSGGTVMPRLFLFTIQETYSSSVPYSPQQGWQKEFDLTPFNVNIFEDSSVAVNPVNRNQYIFTGGLSLNRSIIFQQSPIAVTANQRIGDLQYLPQNIVLRTPANPGDAVQVFYSVSGAGGDSPALYRQANATTTPWTSAPENSFGTSGAGAVTSGVGTLRFGPDGLLNVIDTGAQRIVRYNPDTLAYVSEFALGNTHTDRNDFVITPNGFILTAFAEGSAGAIYSYATGAFLGNYGLDTTVNPSVGFGGKTSMTVDAATGLVYVLTGNSSGEGLFVYNTVDLMDPTVGTIVAFQSGESRAGTLGTSQLVYLSAASGVATQSGAISGSGSIVKTGAGTVVLSGDNTYTGGTTINNGTLVAAFTGAKGTFANSSTVTVNYWGTLAVDGESLGSGAGTASVVLNRGTLSSTSTTGQATTLRDVTMTGGLITKSGNGRFILDGAITTTTSYVEARIDADLELRNAASFNVPASLHSRVTPLTVTSTVSGSGPFVKNGAGVLYFAGTGTYTGETLVNGGTLLLGENTTLASPVITVAQGAVFDRQGGLTITAGQTLRGSGTVGGTGRVTSYPITLAAGAHLAPGNSPGTLTFASGLILADGCVLDLELGSASDLIRVSGGPLTGSAAAGGITINLADSGGFIAGTYTLVDFTGATLDGFDLSDFTLGDKISGYTYAFGFAGNTLVLNASAIPEPATCTVLAGAITLALAGSRRRGSKARGSL